MSKSCQANKITHALAQCVKVTSWDEAISRMDAELDRFERHVTRLKAAKKTFLMLKNDGMEWPGSVQTVVDGLRGAINEKAEKADALSAVTRNTETLTAV